MAEDIPNRTTTRNPPPTPTPWEHSETPYIVSTQTKVLRYPRIFRGLAPRKPDTPFQMCELFAKSDEV
jgi:hypothetical protein